MEASGPVMRSWRGGAIGVAADSGWCCNADLTPAKWRDADSLAFLVRAARDLLVLKLKKKLQQSGSQLTSHRKREHILVS